MVECKWQIDFDRGIKRLFRTDTYEKIPDTETKITEEERQMGLNDVIENNENQGEFIEQEETANTN